MKRIIAALSFFTRIPFWRIASPDREDYERVVPLWPLTGWFTGGVMALTYYICTLFSLPTHISVLMTFGSRILITGGLHEDGFADFCDGFGGGTTRERILQIMKDSHIGTYGVIALIFHFGIMYEVVSHLLGYIPSPFVFVVADSGCKALSSMIVHFLPYARKEEEAKSRLVYTRTTIIERIISFVIGFMPMILFLIVCPDEKFLSGMITAITISAIACLLLFRRMHVGIQGYTGDCCGATFLVAEDVFFLTMLIWFS